MQSLARLWLALILQAALTSAVPVRAQIVNTPRDMAMQVSAVVRKAPPCITLTWPDDKQFGFCYLVWRRLVGETSWGEPLAKLPFHAREYADTGVNVSARYEYRVGKLTSLQKVYSYGYLWSGIEVPLVEDRGTVVLVVDTKTAAEMPDELRQWQLDLVGDGWKIIRHDVAPTEKPAAIRALLQRDYFTAPDEVKAVFLFGRVPIVKSGFISPDGHAGRPFPCDPFYADMDGVWTDTSNYFDGKHKMYTPNDGKYDQGGMPSPTELACGRVYMNNLPTFAKTYPDSPFVPRDETALLRQYLVKDHQFRQGIIAPERIALFDDAWFRRNKQLMDDGWRSIAPLVGPERIFEKRWRQELKQQSYLWAVGGGPGNYHNAGGVTSSENIATDDPKAVFTMLFGSYFCEWDTRDNLLRSVLATSTGLTSQWAVWPFRRLFPMAMGETAGYAMRMSQSDDGTQYPAQSSSQIIRPLIAVALMGDPTLRMHVVPPAAEVAVAREEKAVEVSWKASPDAAVCGYHVYRAPSELGPFTRVNAQLLTATTCRDTAPLPGTNVYMVRAVKLEVGASGSYFNAGNGAFATVALPAPAAQPDLLVKRHGDALFTGDNLYREADPQARGQLMLGKSAQTWLLQVQNDGAAEDTLTLNAPASPTGWTVKYFDAPTGGLDITAEVTGKGYAVPAPASGAVKDIRVEVAQAQPGAKSLAVPVRLASARNKRSEDRVTLTALPVVTCQPDLSVCEITETATVGAGVFSNGDDQLLSRSIQAGQKARYEVTLTNTGALPGTFLLTRDFTTGIKWQFWQLKFVDGQRDISNDMYNGCLLTLAPGASRIIRVDVISNMKKTFTPGETAHINLIASSLGANPNFDTVKIEMTATPPEPAPYRPDMALGTVARQARLDPFTRDNDVYNDDTVQRMQVNQRPAFKTTYHLSLQNDSADKVDTIRVTGVGSGDGWTVQYFDAPVGGADITAQVAGAGWDVPLEPGAFRDFRMLVIATEKARAGVPRDIVVTGASLGKPAMTDRVTVAVTTHALVPADLMLKRAEDQAYTGEKVMPGAGMPEQILTGAIAPNKTGIFLLKATTTDPTQEIRINFFQYEQTKWTVRYFDADGHEATGLLQRAIPLIMGENREFRLEVTPPPGTKPGATATFYFSAAANTPMPQSDSIKLILTCK